MHLEACKELRALVSVLGTDEDWSELDEKIWLLNLNMKKNEGGEGGSVSGNSTSNASSISSRKKGKGGGKGKNKGAVSAAKIATVATNANVNGHLDIVDVLDLDISQRQKVVKCTAPRLPFSLEPIDIVDEVSITNTIHR